MYKKVMAPEALIFRQFQWFFNFWSHISWKLMTINNHSINQMWSEWWIINAFKISGQLEKISRNYCPNYAICFQNFDFQGMWIENAKFQEDWSTYMKVMAPEMLIFSTIPVSSIFEAIYCNKIIYTIKHIWSAWQIIYESP